MEIEIRVSQMLYSENTVQTELPSKSFFFFLTIINTTHTLKALANFFCGLQNENKENAFQTQAICIPLNQSILLN